LLPGGKIFSGLEPDIGGKIKENNKIQDRHDDVNKQYLAFIYLGDSRFSDTKRL